MMKPDITKIKPTFSSAESDLNKYRDEIKKQAGKDTDYLP